VIATHCIERKDYLAGQANTLGKGFRKLDGGGFGINLTAVIMAAGTTNVMRALYFATVRAFGGASCLERMMRTAHALTGRRNFSFWYSHNTLIEYRPRKRPK
jgi:hypothetical protein